MTAIAAFIVVRCLRTEWKREIGKRKLEIGMRRAQRMGLGGIYG
jgi:hypothetical protein